MNKMQDQDELFISHVLRLKNQPDAVPPPGLDPAKVAIASMLAAYWADATPSAEQLTEVRARAMANIRAQRQATTEPTHAAEPGHIDNTATVLTNRNSRKLGFTFFQGTTMASARAFTVVGLLKLLWSILVLLAHGVGKGYGFTRREAAFVNLLFNLVVITPLLLLLLIAAMGLKAVSAPTPTPSSTMPQGSDQITRVWILQDRNILVHNHGDDVDHKATTVMLKAMIESSYSSSSQMALRVPVPYAILRQDRGPWRAIYPEDQWSEATTKVSTAKLGRAVAISDSLFIAQGIGSKSHSATFTYAGEFREASIFDISARVKRVLGRVVPSGQWREVELATGPFVGTILDNHREMSAPHVPASVSLLFAGVNTHER